LPIPNIATLYQRIHSGPEGGKEFARIVDLLLTAEANESDYEFTAINDDVGDAFGVDAFGQGAFRLDYDEIVGFQYKFFPRHLSSQQRHVIRSAFMKALNRFPKMQRWTLVTPEDFHREDAEWFEQFKNQFHPNNKYLAAMNEFVGSRNVRITHWGHTRLVELALRYSHVGRQVFPDLFTPEVRATDGTLEISSIYVDVNQCNWVNALDRLSFIKSQRPLWMNFVAVNSVIVPFFHIPIEFRETMSIAFEFLKRRIINDRTEILAEKDITQFLNLSLEEFYKYLVLYQRGLFNPNDKGKVDLREEALDWLNIREEQAETFYIYKLSMIGVVGRVIRAIWPPYYSLYEFDISDEMRRRLSGFHRVFLRINDPVFDFCLINLSTRTHVIDSFVALVNDIWSEPKAGPTAQLLLPIASYEARIDWSKKVNVIALEPPFSVGSEQPVRIQIKVPLTGCNGNFARVAFGFRGTCKVLPAYEYVLDF